MLSNNKFLLLSYSHLHNNPDSYRTTQLINYFITNNKELYYLPINANQIQIDNIYLDNNANNNLIIYKNIEDIKDYLIDDNITIIINSSLIHYIEILKIITEYLKIDISKFTNKFVSFLNILTENENLQLIRQIDNISKYIILPNEHFKNMYKQYFKKPTFIYNGLIPNILDNNYQMDKELLNLKQKDNIIISTINYDNNTYYDILIKVFINFCLELYNSKSFDISLLKLIIVENNISYDIQQIIYNQFEYMKNCLKIDISDEFIKLFNSSIIIMLNNIRFSYNQLYTIYNLTDIYINLNNKANQLYTELSLSLLDKIIIYPNISSFNNYKLLNSEYTYNPITDIIACYNNQNSSMNTFGGKLYIYDESEILNIIKKAFNDFTNNNININNSELKKFIKNYSYINELDYLFKQINIEISNNHANSIPIETLYQEKIEKNNNTQNNDNIIIENSVNNSLYYSDNNNQKNKINDLNNMSKEQLIAELMKYKAIAAN